MKTINAVLMVIAVLLLVAGCAQSKDVPIQLPATIEEESSAVSSESLSSVVIENDAYNPADVVIKAGDVVSWLNSDDTEHTVTFDHEIVDELLPVGASVSHTFTEVGEYTYHCKIHSTMEGKVIVE